MYSLRDPLQDIRPAITVSLKMLEDVPNKSAATLNTKFEVSNAAILSFFPSPYLAHALTFYGAANVF